MNNPMKNKKLLIASIATASAFIVYRSLNNPRGVKVKRSITIEKTPEELYRYWRNVQNLPSFVDHIESVNVVDDKLSHWTFSAPGGIHLEWYAEITVDRENEMIGWRTVGSSMLETAGYIRFDRATGGRGTVVRVALQYKQPTGKIGNAIATALGERPKGQVEEALRKFKQLMETGEIAVACGKCDEVRLVPREVDNLPHSTEPVQAASEDSFPASDSPAWTGITAV
jgi:uncharacterized membrane protein